MKDTDREIERDILLFSDVSSLGKITSIIPNPLSSTTGVRVTNIISLLNFLMYISMCALFFECAR